jgi:hypothetical protein
VRRLRAFVRVRRAACYGIQGDRMPRPYSPTSFKEESGACFRSGAGGRELFYVHDSTGTRDSEAGAVESGEVSTGPEAGADVGALAAYGTIPYMPRLSTTLLLVAAAARMAGQEPVIRIDVELVQVDAVVTDSRSKHVGNLKAGDFEILQDGKPQTITNFSYIAPAPLPTTRGPGSVMPPQFARAPLKAGEVRRMVAMVVDDLALSSDGVTHVRDALRKFVNRAMQPGDMVAIIRTSGVWARFSNSAATGHCLTRPSIG